MTLQECYVKIGGDYNDILHRFMNENMVRKFVLKFPQDNKTDFIKRIVGLPGDKIKIVDVKKQYDIVIEAIAALG